MSGLSKIISKKVVIVEGKDEALFISTLLSALQIQDTQIIDAGGKANLMKRVKLAIMDESFADVTHLAIIRDADENAKSARDSVLHWPKRRGLPVPNRGDNHAERNGFRLSVWITPNNSDPGMLEDLYLKCLSNEPLANLAMEYIEAIRKSYPNPIEKACYGICENNSKALVHAALTATNGPIKSMGVAAQAGYWRTDHAELEQLRSFLVKAFA